jgi:putative ABC transport system substrate-binding protein
MIATMKRREFITLLGGVAAAWPLAAQAQQAERVRHVAVLMSGARDDPEMLARLAAFRQELSSLGWAEGRNVSINTRFADGKPDQFSTLSKELVALRPDVIVAHSAPVAAALKRESRAIPIVFAYVSDPFGSELVTSLARPGGNLTGLLLYEEGITGKWLGMLKEIEPRLTRAALVANPKTSPFDYFLRAAKTAAPSLRIELAPNPVETAADIERITASMGAPNDGLLLLPDTTTTLHRDLIIALTAQRRLPAVYSLRVFVEAGGLMSYGTDSVHVSRQVASYVDRILRGSKPADLPVQAPTKYQTVVNLKTAKALGFDVPPTLLVRADEVIE